jgi:hypothetical protein
LTGKVVLIVVAEDYLYELGKCWFCGHKMNYRFEFDFSIEFNTHYHVGCLEWALMCDPGNPEALLIDKERLIERCE